MKNYPACKELMTQHNYANEDKYANGLAPVVHVYDRGDNGQSVCIRHIPLIMHYTEAGIARTKRGCDKSDQLNSSIFLTLYLSKEF